MNLIDAILSIFGLDEKAEEKPIDEEIEEVATEVNDGGEEE
tara:strand:- start:1124 stop:1246 length:123 start_codon:yes stop_codon:yes gene_type:complete